MGIHYNAFISYRHHPDDIRVAMEIHKGLEHFKIPRAIRKKSGALRLFRDKEELPITSHLTDDIGHALENSDFLIVICSPHTKESVWVQREIETFLKSHSRDRVLTVLASGEPYDVIPEILLYEDVLNPVTGQIQREEIEPLSCDWRMKKRKAVREELPRLAAPLLGCAYDELRQRQRQYRMRRTIAAFSAALVASLGLTAYFIHTSIQIQKANDDLHAANEVIREANVQIQNNLDQALRNQSQYLASSATERMEAGDRLTALALAMEALPSEDDKRPYVPEAEYALSNALKAYQQEDEITALGSFEVGGLVRQFLVSEDGMTIYVRDARDVVSMWDTVSFQKKHTLDVGGTNVDTMHLTKAGNLIFTSRDLGGAISCYSPDGTQLWSVPDGRDIAFLDDGQTLMLMQYAYGQYCRILFLDPDTGAENAQSVDISNVAEGLLPSGFFQDSYSSSDPITLEYFYSMRTFLYVLRLPTGELTQLLEVDSSFSGAQNFVDCVAIDQNGNILVMRGDGSGINNGTYQNFEITGTDSADILCFDGKTLQQKWKSRITTYIYTGMSTMEPIPDSQWLLCQSGNTFQIHDSLTGQCLKQYQSPSIPLDMTVEGDSVWGVLENGAYFSFDFDSESCYAMSFMEDNIDMAVANRGYFVHSPLERQVTVYRSVRDVDGVELEGEYSYSVTARSTHGSKLAVWDQNSLRMLDMSSQKVLWDQELDYGWDYLGFSKDGSGFWMWNRYDEYARCFAADTGRSRDVTVPMGDLYCYPDSGMFLAEDTLLYMMEVDGKTELWRVALNTGEALPPVQIPEFAQEEMDDGKTTVFLTADDSYAWVWRSEQIFVIDLHTGSLHKVRDGITAKPRLDKAGEKLLMCHGTELLVADMDGTITSRIHLGENKAVSACAYENAYLVLCDDGDVYRYDAQGKQLSKTGLHIYNTFSGNVNYPSEDPMDVHWWITDDGDVIVNAFGAGNIINCDQWQIRAFVPNLFICSPEGDTLFCHCNERLYAYSRYSTAQQMEKARQTLGDFQLSEEDRKSYGLN